MAGALTISPSFFRLFSYAFCSISFAAENPSRCMISTRSSRATGPASPWLRVATSLSHWTNPPAATPDAALHEAATGPLEEQSWRRLPPRQRCATTIRYLSHFATFPATKLRARYRHVYSPLELHIPLLRRIVPTASPRETRLAFAATSIAGATAVSFQADAGINPASKHTLLLCPTRPCDSETTSAKRASKAHVTTVTVTHLRPRPHVSRPTATNPLQRHHMTLKGHPRMLPPQYGFLPSAGGCSANVASHFDICSRFLSPTAPTTWRNCPQRYVDPPRSAASVLGAFVVEKMVLGKRGAVTAGLRTIVGPVVRVNRGVCRRNSRSAVWSSTSMKYGGDCESTDSSIALREWVD